MEKKIKRVNGKKTKIRNSLSDPQTICGKGPICNTCNLCNISHQLYVNLKMKIIVKW